MFIQFIFCFPNPMLCVSLSHPQKNTASQFTKEPHSFFFRSIDDRFFRQAVRVQRPRQRGVNEHHGHDSHIPQRRRVIRGCRQVATEVISQETQTSEGGGAATRVGHP